MMTEAEAHRLRHAEQNIRTLEIRIVELEKEMALCLKFMRIHAEKLAHEKDPSFVVHENVEA